jgi:hypothetical protein
MQTGDRQANCRISWRATKKETLDIVEGETPSETEEETALA